MTEPGDVPAGVVDAIRAEVSEVVTESYCLLAPNKLAATVDISTS